MSDPRDFPNSPTPENELERIMALSELDLDYLDLGGNLADLTQLAAKIAGTKVSLVNLIDHYTQWSVSTFGLDLVQMPREESICQYLIADPTLEDFEIRNLADDDRFKANSFVQSDPSFNFYYGIPLKLNETISLGALCVMDTDLKSLSPERKEMLGILAREVVNRIKMLKTIEGLHKKLHEAILMKNKVAHDIRGPLGGIIGLAQLIQMEGDQNNLKEVLEFTQLIEKSGNTLLELADDILSQDWDSRDEIKSKKPKKNEFNLLTLKEKLISMFEPQALIKEIHLAVEVNTPNAEIPFPKNKIIQVLGNLISNSLKFTPAGGQVNVLLDLEIFDLQKILLLEVRDTGIGMTSEKIKEILTSKASSSEGTIGETGFGFGLSLVKYLIQSLSGKIDIASTPGLGTNVKVIIPY